MIIITKHDQLAQAVRSDAAGQKVSDPLIEQTAGQKQALTGGAQVCRNNCAFSLRSSAAAADYSTHITIATHPWAGQDVGVMARPVKGHRRPRRDGRVSGGLIVDVQHGVRRKWACSVDQHLHTLAAQWHVLASTTL